MCCAPAPSGAAIRNTRSAGPSGAPKSTPGDNRAKPTVGVDGRRTAMRNCDPTGKTCRRLLFASHDGIDEGLRFRGAPARDEQSGELR